MNYETFIQVSKFDNALFHFGNLVNNEQLKSNSEYHLEEAISCIKALEQFPVVTCDEKLTRKGYFTITSRWTFGERKICLYPNEAKAAMKWVDDLREQFYSGKLHEWRNG